MLCHWYGYATGMVILTISTGKINIVNGGGGGGGGGEDLLQIFCGGS